jgi:uncharacterized protein (TIGR00661 family)
MATILYGVNGEGAGHSTRAREVLTHLREQGHTLHVVSFDRGRQNLAADFEVTEIHGLRFAYVNNQVRYRRTVTKNLRTVPKAARSLHKLSGLVEDWGIEIVITDFEPLSCQIGRSKGLPVISIDNQHCLTNAEVSYPKEYRRDATLAKLVTRMMIPRAEAYLVTSFFPARVKKRGTYVLPPILREQILRAKATTGDHVLVYVTSPAPELARLLSGIRCPFIAYGFGREGANGNITYKKPSMEGFFADLTSAKAIIANAGFSLVTEALHLGKPYLAVPVQHQFEQIFNAYWLDKMGYGAYWEELSKERVESFLFNLPHFAERLSQYPRQDNSALFAKLDELIARLAG